MERDSRQNSNSFMTDVEVHGVLLLNVTGQ